MAKYVVAVANTENEENNLVVIDAYSEQEALCLAVGKDVEDYAEDYEEIRDIDMSWLKCELESGSIMLSMPMQIKG